MWLCPNFQGFAVRQCQLRRLKKNSPSFLKIYLFERLLTRFEIARFATQVLYEKYKTYIFNIITL